MFTACLDHDIRTQINGGYMKKEKLKKLKVDLDYIDPVTLEKVCSFNQCIDKFIEQGTEEITFYPKWKEGSPLVKISHFHICSECGRKYKSKLDTKKNLDSYYEALAGGGHELNKTTEEEV